MPDTVAVQHCAELLASARAPFDLHAASGEFAAELAQALPERLQPLLIGPRPIVTDCRAELTTAAALASTMETPSIHYALSFGPGQPTFVVSFGNALALALTDRLFGGRGELIDSPARVLPQSAVLSLERLVRAVADTLGPLCGQSEVVPRIASHPVFRRLGAFKRDDPAISWTMTVEQEGHEPWTLWLAASQAAMRPLLVEYAGGEANGNGNQASDPLATAMAVIPLPLTAVLAELVMPLDRLAALKPGDAIPLSPRRDVPLSIGSRVIAHGSIGALDERVALRLTRLT